VICSVLDNMLPEWFCVLFLCLLVACRWVFCLSGDGVGGQSRQSFTLAVLEG
jgi:hypothetical protein